MSSNTLPQLSACPEAAHWRRLLLDQLPASEAQALQRHLDGCPECQAIVREMKNETISPESASSVSDLQPPVDEYRTPTPPLPNFPTGVTRREVSVALAPPQGPGELGRISIYRVLKELGKGGMGAVYLAEDAQLRRRVALKIMLAACAADPIAKERFLREARAAAAIKHDNVITIHHVAEANGCPFIVMEFLEGVSLDRWLLRKPRPALWQILRIGREAAEGLAAAHRLGMVHRDVKPANLWLEAPTGRVKVLDFGLAHVERDDAQLTGPGQVMGTPAYMSPEQGRGQQVDHRSDLFSLGCVLYRLCTGNPPFRGNTAMAMLTALAVDTPAPIAPLNPEIPAALEALVMQLLEKDPARRSQSAQGVADALRAIAHDITARAQAISAAPIPVAAAFEANPFEDLTEPLTPPVAEPTSAPPTPVRNRGRWAMLGVPAAAAVVLIAVIALSRKPAESSAPTKSGEPQDVAKVPKKLDDTPDDQKKKLAPGQAEFEKWVKDTAALPLKARMSAFIEKMKEINLGFDSKHVKWNVTGETLHALELITDEVNNLSAIRALSDLPKLHAIGSERGRGRLRDLGPVSSLSQLNWLHLTNNPVSDLSPIQTLRLVRLDLQDTEV